MLLNAGGEWAQTVAPTPLTRESKPFIPKTNPLPELDKLTVTGLQELDDGRVIEAFNRIRVVTPPENLTSHPIRDVWLLDKHKWVMYQKNVAWEEDETLDEILDKEYDACICIYRRSGRDYRRHAEAEAYLHREIDGIRNSGGNVDNAPRKSEADIDLIMGVPHSVQPVILEDNQATIRILESGKSPAFRHADKTQRLNLGWISEQFKRKHYVLAYINTQLQAADVLTKPFTSAEKWNKALHLMCVSRHKLPARKTAVAASDALARQTPRPEAAFKRVLFILDNSKGSHALCDVDVGYSPDTKVFKFPKPNELDSPESRRAVIQLARDYHKAGALVILWMHLRNPGGNEGVDGKIEVDHFSKTWASFVDIADYIEKIKAKIVITWPRDCSFWGWNRVKRFAERFNLVKASIPRLVEPRLKQTAHYTLASNEQSLVGILRKQDKKQRNTRGRNNAESHSDLDSIMKSVTAFSRDNELLLPAAVALKHQAFPASFSRIRSLAKMSGSASAAQGVANREVVHPVAGGVYATADREERIRIFRDALKDHDRLADAMAGRTHVALHSDLQEAIVEPTADADGEDLFLSVIKVHEWRTLREACPNAHWTALYEAWYRHYACVQGNEVMTRQRDTSLTGWSRVILEYIKDLGIIGWGTKYEEAINRTAMYDICFRVGMMSQGAGTLPMFTESCRLIEGLYSPALGRISPPPSADAGTFYATNFLVAGDSSLAMCWMQGRRCLRKTTIGPTLSDITKSNPEVGEIEFQMEWGKGLDTILDTIDTKLHVAPPDGVELIVYWAGNDVYGNYGYLGYTWHLTSKWVKRPQEEIDRIAHWPAKQKLLVERGIDRLIELLSHPKVRGLTVLVGGDNGRFFNLPAEYDDEMGRHAQKLANGGVTVLDPCSLLMRTSRPDGFHMEVNEHNATVAASWWHSLIRAILTDRLVTGRKAEFIANKRSIVFHNHFVLGKPEPSLTVPPASKRILEPLEPVLHQDEEVEPEEARDDEEQIVFDQPVMQLLPDVVTEPALTSEDGEEVTQVDHVLFSRDHDSELPLDLVAVDPDAQEDFAFNLAAEAVNNVSARVDDADAIEKEAEDGIETVSQDEAVSGGTEQPEVPASGEDRVYPHGTVGYSMALRDMGSAPKSKPAPTSDDQVEVKEEVDFDGDEAMGSADATADVLASDESYEMWYSAEDFPDFPSGHRYMSDKARFSLSKTMTFYLRGHSNDERSQRQNRPPPRITIDPTTHAVEWEHFKEILSSCWRNFSSLKAIEVVKFSHSDKDDRGRFEVLVRVHPQGLEYLAIRCFQGHNRNLISEESDLKAIHRDFHFLCSEWEPSLTTFPVVGVTGYTCDKWDSMPKVGYHATFWSNFPNLVAYGLVPGGVTLGGSTGRAFSMMATSPIWLRESNAGLRPGAEVEFAIDLQLAALEGVRIFETKNDVLQTPDWVSNRFFMYAIDRRTGKCVWFNRSYELTRSRVGKAVKAYQETGVVGDVFNSDLANQAAEASSSCVYEYISQMYPIDNETLDWVEFVGYNNNMPRPSHLREESVFNVDARHITFERNSPLEGTRAEWTLDAQVWYSRTGLTKPFEQRVEREDYLVNLNVGFPKYPCPDTRCRYQQVDGFLNCPRCNTKLFHPSDLSHLAELAELRAEALQGGVNFGLMYLAPKTHLNAGRRDHAREGHAQEMSVAATLKAKCKKAVQKIAQSQYDDMATKLAEEPFTAYNFMAKGMTLRSVEEIEMFARVRIPNPGRGTEQKRAFQGSHTADARVAYIFPPHDDPSGTSYLPYSRLTVELATHCFFCFQDRFYLMTEAAVLIRATQIARQLRSRMDEFSILTFQGEEIVIEEGTLQQIMGQLTNLLRTQIRFALNYNERSSGVTVEMVLSNDQPVEIPESWGSMGRHQLLELLKGTRFSVDRRRSWFNSFAAETVEQNLLRQGATSVGAMRVPPPPPSPSGRTGSMGPPPAKAARIPTPAVKEPATPPPRGRSPGGAPGSSTDLPMHAAPAKAGRGSTPPPKARPPAAAARDPASYISAEEWDSYFAGMNEVRGFAVDDSDALPKAPATPARTVTMTPREPDTPPPGHAGSAAGGRARTRSPRRPTDGREEYFRECDQEIENMLQWLDYDFNGFPVDRLRLWRDANGRTFEPDLNLPISYTRVDMWFWAVLRARMLGRVTPLAVPLSIPSFNQNNDLIVVDYTNLTWFIRGWREWREDRATGFRYRLY